MPSEPPKNSLPPEARKALIVWEKILDAVGIVVIGALLYFDKVDSNIALVLIALLAGVNMTDRLRGGGGGGGAGRAAGIVFGMATPVLEVLRRVKG